MQQQFYIVPSRKISGLSMGTDVVLSLNGLRGDLRILAGDGLDMQPPVGGEMTLRVVPGRYVLRSGDSVLGNLDFTPIDNEAYGLGLRAASTDPSTARIGAIYYNTNTNTLRTFTSGGWSDLAQTGALTQGAADARYLKLDGTNSPMQGNLSMGSSLFRLGNRSSDPIGGLAGEVYWNTTTSKPRINIGSSWKGLGGEISAGIGNGLLLNGQTGQTLTESGTLTVDQGFSPVWSGAHTFQNAITFASSQTFDIAKLDAAGQANGQLITRSGGAWGVLAPGSQNQLLRIGPSGLPFWSDEGGGSIGTPAAGQYTDGYFDQWVQATPIPDAFLDVSLFAAATAPDKGTGLSGLSLVLSGAPLYAAKLSDGLPGAWYAGGLAAGDTTDKYTVAAAATVHTPSPSNTFHIGSKNRPSQFGTLTVSETVGSLETDILTYDLTQNVGGSTSAGGRTLNVSVNDYNRVWKIASGSVEVGFGSSDHGLLSYRFKRTASGNEFSAPTVLYRDHTSSVSGPPSFTSAATVGLVLTDTAKWLSGVRYYGLGAQVRVDFVAAAGIFNACYHPTNVATITGAGTTGLSLNPTSVPQFDQPWDCTGSYGHTVTLSDPEQSTAQDLDGTWLDRRLLVTLHKPSGITATSSAPLARAVCTFEVASTDLFERFVDEDRRISALVFPDVESWNSLVTIPNGEAQVRAGVLRYPISADYSPELTPTGDQEYHRLFIIPGRKTGSMAFDYGLASAFDVAMISPYGAGDFNVLCFLEGSELWFDLGVDVGVAFNAMDFARDGSSKTRAIGGRDVGTAGRTLKWSFGEHSTGPADGLNLGRFRFVAVFRNSNKVVQSITVS
jgi:hypothetical protein